MVLLNSKNSFLCFETTAKDYTSRSPSSMSNDRNKVYYSSCFLFLIDSYSENKLDSIFKGQSDKIEVFEEKLLNNTQQGGNGPSRSPAQGSKRAKSLK